MNTLNTITMGFESDKTRRFRWCRFLMVIFGAKYNFRIIWSWKIQWSGVDAYRIFVLVATSVRCVDLSQNCQRLVRFPLGGQEFRTLGISGHDQSYHQRWHSNNSQKESPRIVQHAVELKGYWQRYDDPSQTW